MKTFLLILMAVAFGGGVGLRAQMPGTSQAGLNAAMLQLFNGASFSAKAEVRMLDNRKKETMSMIMDFAHLDGSLRLELDTSKIKRAEGTADTMAQYKMLNMDKMVTVVRPARRDALLIYPLL